MKPKIFKEPAGGEWGFGGMWCYESEERIRWFDTWQEAARYAASRDTDKILKDMKRNEAD